MSSDCQSEDKQTEISKDTDCRRNKIEQIKSETEVNKMQTKEMNIKNLYAKKQDCESNSPTISLCMIVKNEEENLARCLDSARDIVDEIIIVDTGSTDRTVDIAESYGARVFYHPWEGSFSKARNYSLKYATCDWILILDADEELNKEGTPRLKEIAENNECPVVSFIIKNKYKNSTQEGYAQMVRLFKNFSGVHYKGIVHNYYTL